MLYERWLKVSRAHLNEIALRDVATGEEWSFGQLARVAELEGGNDRAIAFPRGSGPEFIFGVLEAWRRGQVACPLETEQAVPLFPIRPPDSILHLKTTSPTTPHPRFLPFTRAQSFAYLPTP